MARVGQGSWLMMGLFIAFFVVAFVQLGCRDLDAASVDRQGAVFGLVITLALLGLALTSFGEGGDAAGGVVKLVLALAFGALALTGFRRPAHSHSQR